MEKALKKILLVGASGGIGRAIATELFSKYRLFITTTKEDSLDSLFNDLPGISGAIFDHTSRLEKDLIEEAHEKLDGLDGIVIASGITSDSLCMRLSDEMWDKTLEVNLSSAFRLIKHANRYLFRSEQGRVIVISSVIARMGNAGQVAYAASKAGLEGMVRSLAREFAGRKITVNAIAPGFIETKMTADLNHDALLETIPLKRIGQPSEIAYGVDFLLSERAGYITGHTLEINGGMWMA